MDLRNADGISVCLMPRPYVIISSLSFEKNSRPLLMGEDRIDKLNLLMQKRVYYYISADILVDTSDKSIDEIVKYICAEAGIKK